MNVELMGYGVLWLVNFFVLSRAFAWILTYLFDVVAGLIVRIFGKGAPVKRPSARAVDLTDLELPAWLIGSIGIGAALLVWIEVLIFRWLT